jgi:hypothetical protein
MTTTVTSQPFDLNRVIDRLNGDISHALSAGDSAYAKEREIIARFLARELDTFPIRALVARASAVVRHLDLEARRYV